MPLGSFSFCIFLLDFPVSLLLLGRESGLWKFFVFVWCSFFEGRGESFLGFRILVLKQYFSAEIGTEYKASCFTLGDYTKPCFESGYQEIPGIFPCLLVFVTVLEKTLVSSVLQLPCFGE